MPLAKRILFSGSIAGHAVGYGGNTWAFLQWILGFRRLGFDVYYVEERQGKDLMEASEMTIQDLLRHTSGIVYGGFTPNPYMKEARRNSSSRS